MDDPVNRVDVRGLKRGWDNVASFGPLSDMLDPTPVNDVYEKTKEFWEKLDTAAEQEDLRKLHQ